MNEVGVADGGWFGCQEDRFQPEVGDLNRRRRQVLAFGEGLQLMGGVAGIDDDPGGMS
ncbi:hypothetical protein D3C72_781420 [compost metagenome]